MDYRVLGKTGLRVSVLGFGCGNVGGLMIRGELGDRVRAVAWAIAAGVNYFDTAPLYGLGTPDPEKDVKLKKAHCKTLTSTFSLSR